LDIKKYILKALDCERELNKSLKAFHKIESERLPDIGIFFFNNILKTSILGYSLLIMILIICILAKLLTNIFLLGLCVLLPRFTLHDRLGYIATSSEGEKHIFHVINNRYRGVALVDLRSTYRVFLSFSWLVRVRIITDVLKVSWYCLVQRKVTTALQVGLVVQLTILARFLLHHPGRPVFSDDQLQRYAYICSTLSDNFNLCQHGQQDTALELEKYGKIHCLWYLNPSDIASFAHYYTIENTADQSFVQPLVDLRKKASISEEKKVAFVASSLPTYDSEMEVLRTLKRDPRIFVAIKFHPVHRYSFIQRLRLSFFSDHVCSRSELPLCDILYSPSYSSVRELYPNVTFISTNEE
jgi:hypothetical protein